MIWSVLLGLALLFNFLVLRPGPHVAGFIGMSLIFAGHTSALTFSASGYVVRAAGLAVLLWAARTARTLPTGEGQSTRLIRTFALLASVAFVFAIVGSGLSMRASGAALVFIGAIVALLQTTRSGISRDVADGALAASALACGLSLLLYFVAPALAIGGTRLRGIFENANTMGFVAATVILWAIVRKGGSWPNAIAASIALAALLLTGSRASIGALATAVLVLLGHSLLQGKLKRFATLFGLTMVAGTVLLVARPDVRDTLLRTQNSRADGTYYALHVAEWSWTSGVGYGESEIEIASTPLRWLAEVGILASVVVIISYAVVLLMAFKHGSGATAIAMFGIVSSSLEGWYFAGGSALFVLHWLILLAAFSPSTNTLHQRVADPPTSARLQRYGTSDRRFRRAVPSQRKSHTRVGGNRDRAPSRVYI